MVLSAATSSDQKGLKLQGGIGKGLTHKRKDFFITLGNKERLLVIGNIRNDPSKG